MEEQKKKGKGRISWAVVLICILILIIIGAIVFMLPKALKDESAVRNTATMLSSEKDEDSEKNKNDNREEKENDSDSEEKDDNSQKDEEINSEEKGEAIETIDGMEEFSEYMIGLSEYEQQKIYDIISEMTLEEKIYQMIIAPPSQITGVATVTAAGSGTESALEMYPVGGLFYNATNLESQEQIVQMLSNTQSYCKIPVLTMCDEEGGTVGRLMNNIGTTYIGSMLDYESQGTEKSYDNAKIIASDMSRLGFNLDLAPVADVWSNSANTVIAERAYSTDFETASELIPAAVKGFHDGGVACTLKHFPGHGDTVEDSHYSTAIVDKSLDELRENELLPFQAGIDAGADAVMMGHLTLPQIDEQPALFSYKIVTELLREEMGFNGIVVTDALEMAAVADYYSSSEIAVNCITAGVDMLLCPGSLTDSVSALENAVNDGTITEKRIDESVVRILALKVRRGII